MYIQLSQLNYVNDEEILQVEWHLADWRQRYIHRWSHLSSTYINIVNISMQARCQLQWRPTFLPSNFYFLRARQGGRSHHATNYESGAKCSADIRVPLAPPSGSAVAAGLRSCGCCPLPPPQRRWRTWTLSLLKKHVRESVVATCLTTPRYAMYTLPVAILSLIIKNSRVETIACSYY